MPASDPTNGVPTPTGTLQGVAAFSWDGAAWQPAGRAGPSVATPTGVLQGVAAFNGGPSWQPSGRAGPGVATPTGVLDGVAVYTWSGSAWTPPGGTPTPSTPSGSLQGVAAFNWDGTAWQPAGQAGPDVSTPYGVLTGVAMFNWTGTAWAAVQGPSLDLSFMNPGALDPRISFTRAAGPATYFDSNGVMRTAANGAPRWDYDPVTLALKGLLIEEARTNVALQSTMGVAPWAAYSAVVGPPVVTANNAAAPDGTTTAARLVFPAVSATATSIWYQPITVTAAAYAFSVWLKGAVGGEQLYMILSGGVNGNGPRLTLTTQWQRFTFITPTLTAGTGNFQIGADPGNYAGQSATPAQTIYVWGAQVEAGAFPTSYIPTTAAAVTRANEACYLPVAAWYNATQGSMAFEYIVEGVTPGYSAPLAFVGANVNTDFINLDSYQPTGATATAPILASTVLEVAGASVYCSYNAVPVPAGVVHKGASAWANSQTITGSHDGVGPTTPSAPITAMPTIAYLLFAGQSGYQLQVSLWARRARYWPRALSAAELQSVTQ